ARQPEWVVRAIGEQPGTVSADQLGGGQLQPVEQGTAADREGRADLHRQAGAASRADRRARGLETVERPEEEPLGDRGDRVRRPGQERRPTVVEPVPAAALAVESGRVTASERTSCSVSARGSACSRIWGNA